MKKTLANLFLAALLAGCAKEAPIEGEIVENIVFDITVNAPGTKAIKTAWETGDVIFVFFSKQTSPAYLELAWNGTGWVDSKKNGLSLKDKEKGTMRAVYLPFGSGTEVVAGENGAYNFKDTYYSYYLTASQSYTVSGGKVTATLNMKIPDGYVQFFINYETPPQYEKRELREAYFTPRAIAGVSAAAGEITKDDDRGAPMPGYEYRKENKDDGEKDGWLFSGILADAARGQAVDYHFTQLITEWVPWVGERHTWQSMSVTGATLHTAGNEKRAVVLTRMAAANPAIDLGVNVNGRRVYWADRLLGASGPGEHGDFYAWGETEPKERYDESTYKFSGGTKKVTRYCPKDKPDFWHTNGTPDGKTVLDLEDDAARVKCGDSWRTPTYDELNALMTQCTWTEGSSPDTGNHGYTVTGPSGNSIFLPTSGHRFDSELIGRGQWGHLWSASVSNVYPYDAFILYYRQNNRLNESQVIYRYSGQLILPVKD